MTKTIKEKMEGNYCFPCGKKHPGNCEKKPINRDGFSPKDSRAPEPAEGEMIQLDESSEMCPCFIGHEEGKECPCEKCHPGNSPSENEGWRLIMRNWFAKIHPLKEPIYAEENKKLLAELESFISQVEKEAEARGEKQSTNYADGYADGAKLYQSTYEVSRQETLAETQKFVEEELKTEDSEAKGYEILGGLEKSCCPGDDCWWGYERLGKKILSYLADKMNQSKKG